MAKITLPGGEVREVDLGTPAGTLLPRDAIAARVDGRLVDLFTPIEEDAEIEPVLPSDPDGLHVLCHSTAHVMAQAVCDLVPGAKYAVGPPIEDGFYYDFDLPQPLTADDLPRIEARMGEIVAADQPFRREELAREEALERFRDQEYKREIIETLEAATDAAEDIAIVLERIILKHQ